MEPPMITARLPSRCFELLIEAGRGGSGAIRCIPYEEVDASGRFKGAASPDAQQRAPILARWSDASALRAGPIGVHSKLLHKRQVMQAEE